MCFSNLARRFREKVDFEFETGAVVAYRLVELLCEGCQRLHEQHERRDIPVSSDTSPSVMYVSANFSMISSSSCLRLSYSVRARSSTSHAALKSSSGSPSCSSSSSSSSSSSFAACANRSTGSSSSSSSSASPEKDRNAPLLLASSETYMSSFCGYHMHGTSTF